MIISTGHVYDFQHTKYGPLTLRAMEDVDYDSLFPFKFEVLKTISPLLSGDRPVKLRSNYLTMKKRRKDLEKSL